MLCLISTLARICCSMISPWKLVTLKQAATAAGVSENDSAILSDNDGGIWNSDLYLAPARIRVRLAE
jgi:hypothetical protein